MKNIHLISTDKPSKLQKTKHDNFFLSFKVDLFTDCTSQHIYITSDEEIKDSWILNTHTNEVYFLKGYYGIQPTTKKIILTTDQDLIKDDVQNIDDEFLQWFVKNPSCEEVKAELQYQYHSSKEFYHDADYVNCTKEQYESIKKEIPTCPLRILYKIIIPKEEPKCTCKEHDPYCCQIHGSCPTCVKQEEPNKTHYLDELPNMDKEVLVKMWESAMPKLKPKQKTLEEAGKRVSELVDAMDSNMEMFSITNQIDELGYTVSNMRDIIHEIVKILDVK